MQDAQDRAGLLAKAGGASVGEVLVISENAAAPRPLMMPAAGAADAAAKSVPVQPGEQSYSADVQVTFALK
jgi:uncharacterized protein YggE